MRVSRGNLPQSIPHPYRPGGNENQWKVRALVRSFKPWGLFLLTHCWMAPVSAQLIPERPFVPDDLLYTRYQKLNLWESGNTDGPKYRSSTPVDGVAVSNGSSGIQPREVDARTGEKITWAPAIMESLLSTGIMHSFNLGTEPGTRDTLNGHWFNHYVSSVAELRGWSDSDTFMAPYVGHPLEGSIFGYILRQNDPKYQNVQWGDGREYCELHLRLRCGVLTGTYS